MRILIGTTNPSKIGYFETLLADAVICADSGLYFDSLPLDDPRQPGLHVRTPSGTRLGDEQMEKPYTARLKTFLRQSLDI